jgi:hypothetical protein
MRKAIYIYALITQLIFTMIGFAVAGFFLGRHLNYDSNLDVQLLGAGLGISLIYNGIFMVRVLKDWDRKEAKAKEKEALKELESDVEDSNGQS